MWLSVFSVFLRDTSGSSVVMVVAFPGLEVIRLFHAQLEIYPANKR